MTADPHPAARPKPAWVLREGTPNDIPGILECFEASYAAHARGADYWRWEFQDNHAGPARYFVADHDGRIVGYYAVVPQTFLISGVEHAGSIVVDVMTHPDYQRQGMFTKLGRFALDHCTADARFEFTTGYPIRPAVIPGHLNVGWKIRFKIGTWVQVLSAASILRARIKPLAQLPLLADLLGWGPGIMSRAWGSYWVSRGKGLLMDGGHGHPIRTGTGGTPVSGGLGTGRKLQVERLDRVDHDRFGRFLSRLLAAMPPGSVIQKRTPEYMQWRYDNKPSQTYAYHAAVTEDREIVGLAVVRGTELLGVNTMAVLDALALDTSGGRPAILRSLFADIRGSALAQDAALVAMMITQPNPIVPSPWQLGFIPAPYRFSFITRGLAEGTVIDSDGLAWHLMWADTDDM